MTQAKVDLIFIKSIFEDHLLKGDASIITDRNIAALNAVAMRLYELSDPLQDKDDIECLKYLMMICNILYNRTDTEILPIEDEVYDLLLEKYKRYNSEFQVGAAVVEFQSTIQKDPNYKQVICPIIIYNDDKKRDELSQSIYDEIMRTGKPILNQYDLVKPVIEFEPGYIEKKVHDTEHNHPQLVGTLDKCKFVFMDDAIAVGADNDPNVKVLERDFFGDHIKKGIIRPDQKISIVLELKYDGVSVEADCDNEVQSARTRGDTGIGKASDVTPIFKGYSFRHAKTMIAHKPIGVKFEAIMTKSALGQYSRLREYNYVNCRYAIIGLFTASDAYLYRDLITLVPLEVDRNDLPLINNRVTEIEFLNEVFQSNGEPLRYCVVEDVTIPQALLYTKKFLQEAADARDYLNFMYDGIVVSYLDEDIRAKLGRENHINKYSMAVKFNPLSKITTFRGYTYEVGQNGNITPMIHYDPVGFLGTIHTKSTGSSLKRFNDLALKYGDHIEVTYRNDVMPYVSRVDSVHNRENPNPIIEPPTTCPVCGSNLVVSESGKTLKCPNRDCSGRKVARTANMLSKLNLKGFGEQMVKAIDKYNLRELVDLDMEYLGPRIGEGNAANFMALMNDLKTLSIYDYQIVGALGFTGLASKTWKTIFQAGWDIDAVLRLCDPEYNKVVRESGLLAQIPGIGQATVDTICNEVYDYKDDLEYISNMTNIIPTPMMSDTKQIRFSGCRDLQLEQQLCREGYDADSSSSATKKTNILLVPYEGYTSTKTRKVGPDCKIIPIEEFRSNMNLYLS